MRKKLWLIVLAALSLLVGCERRPLELMYRNTVRVIVKCLWQVRAYPDGEKPSGVTMYFFRDGEFFNSVTTSNVDSCEVQLPPGHYKMYMISQSPEEYWKMEFDNMTSFPNAAMTLRKNDTPWARTRATDVVVENPEVLCAGVADEFDISYEMTEDYQYYFTNLQKYLATRRNKTRAGEEDDPNEAYLKEKIEYYTIRIPVYPTNVVSQLWVTIYAGRADVLQSVRASMSGMARTWELTRGVTAKDEAVQMLTQWTLTMDDYTNRVGHIDGIITTLGLPDGQMPSAARDSTLNVSTLLVDNSTVADYVFSIGDKIQLLEPNPGYRGLYRVVFGSMWDPAIILPDVSPGSGGGGFVAGVQDWGDEVEADLIL